MLRQFAYPLLLLFAIFTLTTASDSVQVANDFFDWLDSGLGSVRGFVTTVLDRGDVVDPAVTASAS